MRKNYKDDFELLYLRHDYLSRAGALDGKYYEEYRHIIAITASIIYERLRHSFAKVGFDKEDVESIASIYALTYMNLYSIRNNEDQRNKFLRYFKRKNGSVEPTEKDMKDAEQNQMITFIRQKLSHCAVVCTRKSRDIICGRNRSGLFAFTSESMPVSDEEILENPEKHGYRCVTIKEFKESQARARVLGEKQTVDDNGYKIFKIEIISNGISRDDYEDLVDRQISNVLKNPEARLIEKEEDLMLEKFKRKFDNMSKTMKKRKLTKFIEEYGGHYAYQEQVKVAKKMLRKNNFMV